MLEVKDLHFEYSKENPILKNIHLLVHPGEIVWLQGANGSGKSTLLRIIAQLIEASGEFCFKHKRIQNREDLLSHLAYFPDEPYLFEYLTGEENGRFLQRLFGVPDRQFEEIFYPLISSFGLTESLNHYVQEYSLGMRHKLYWAAMFARDVEVYLFDEPFAPFDKKTQVLAKELLREKAGEGAMVIFVSHLHEIGEQLSTVSYQLADGMVERVDKDEYKAT